MVITGPAHPKPWCAGPYHAPGQAPLLRIEHIRGGGLVMSERTHVTAHTPHRVTIDSGRAPRSGRSELVCVWGKEPQTGRAIVLGWVRRAIR
jgi:hypothetical protein